MVRGRLARVTKEVSGKEASQSGVAKNLSRRDRTGTFSFFYHHKEGKLTTVDEAIKLVHARRRLTTSRNLNLFKSQPMHHRRDHME